MTVYLHEAAAIETGKLLQLLITHNMDSNTRLWGVFKSKEEGKGKLLTIGEDGRSLEAIKSFNCTISYRFGYNPVHVHEKKPRKNTSSSGGKSNAVPERFAETIDVERAGPSREVNLLPTVAEKLETSGELGNDSRIPPELFARLAKFCEKKALLLLLDRNEVMKGRNRNGKRCMRKFSNRAKQTRD